MQGPGIGGAEFQIVENKVSLKLAGARATRCLSNPVREVCVLDAVGQERIFPGGESLSAAALSVKQDEWVGHAAPCAWAQLVLRYLRGD